MVAGGAFILGGGGAIKKGLVQQVSKIAAKVIQVMPHYLCICGVFLLGYYFNGRQEGFKFGKIKLSIITLMNQEE